MYYDDIAFAAVCIGITAYAAYVLYRYNTLSNKYMHLNEQYMQKCEELEHKIKDYEDQLSSWVEEAQTILDPEKLREEIFKLK